CPMRLVCDAGRCANNCALGLTNCSGSCADLSIDNLHCGMCGVVCRGGATCNGGQCKCPVNRSVCGGVCVGLTVDATNCGGCGVVCAVGQTCVVGKCI